MRLFITPDLHGALPKVYSRFDRVVCVGDYRSSPQREYIFKAMKEKMDGKSIDWWDYVGKKKAKQLEAKGCNDGIKLLKFLKNISKPEELLLIPGNWDNTKEEVTYWAPTYKVNIGNKDHTTVVKQIKGIKDFHKKKVEFENFVVIGYGISNCPELPIRNKKRFTKQQLVAAKKRFDKTFDMIGKHFVYAKKKKKPVIFVTHNVPYNTKLDIVKNKQSPANGLHVGSLMARKLIEKYQPLVCFGGHMHEHFGFDKINKTVVVNVGYGSTKNTYLDIDDKKARIELWQGNKLKKKKVIHF